MSSNPVIFVTGASGKVGRTVIAKLVSQGKVHVIAGVRDLRKATQLQQLGAEARRFDLDEAETIAAALRGVDRAVLITGYSVEMLRQSMRFLDASRAAGVQHIVHLGASGAPTAEVAHWGWHRFIEAYIEKLGFTFTHLQPEAFMQNITGPGYRWLENDRLTHFIGDAKWTWADARDVGEVIAVTLAQPELHQGKTYRLGTDGKTMAEVAAILGQACGRAIQVEAASPDRFLAAALDSGADPAYMRCVHRQFQLDAAGLIPGAGDIYPDVEQLLQRPGTTWEAFATQWAAGKR